MILTNCSHDPTSYKKQKNNFFGSAFGFSETKLSDTDYIISFKGNNDSKLEVVADYALLRSAEVAKFSNFKYFHMEREDQSYEILNTAICNSYTFTCIPVNTKFPIATNVIKLVSDDSVSKKNPTQQNLYDAELLIKKIREKYNITTIPIPFDINRKSLLPIKLPAIPEDGYATVYVVRPKLEGMLIRFNVFLDDQEKESEMGYTRGRQYIYFNVKAGNHTIFSQAENLASIDIKAKSKEVIIIIQETRTGSLTVANNLKRVTEIEAREYMKNTKLGTIKKIKKD